jgi:hypothetical protein
MLGRAQNFKPQQQQAKKIKKLILFHIGYTGTRRSHSWMHDTQPIKNYLSNNNIIIILNKFSSKLAEDFGFQR